MPITLSRPLTWCLLLGEGSSSEVSGCAGGTFRHCQYPLSIRSAYLAVVRISGWLAALRLANTARNKISIPSAHILHLARQRGRLSSGQVVVVVANFSDFSTPPGPYPGIRGAQLAGVSLRTGDGGRSASSATSHRNGSAENHSRPGNEDLHAGKSGSRPATASRRLSPSARRLDRAVRATRGGKP